MGGIDPRDRSSDSRSILMTALTAGVALVPLAFAAENQSTGCRPRQRIVISGGAGFCPPIRSTWLLPALEWGGMAMEASADGVA